MGLRNEAFFILKSEGGALKEATCRPHQSKWACPGPQGTVKW